MRDQRIDFLRFLGLSLIILAHVSPPDALFQLRNFDVPLMILVSGLSFAKTQYMPQFQTYVYKRFRRLVMPVWLFLGGYFCVVYFFLPELEILSIELVRDSFLLIDGIGYVWIIRVFLLVALAAPLVLWLNKRVPDNNRYLGLLAGLYIAYECLLLVTGPYIQSGAGYWFGLVVLYAYPYTLIFALGIRLPLLPRSTCIRIALIAALLFAGLGVWYAMDAGRFMPTQTFKYPPQLYYFAYALAMSLLAWLATPWLIGQISRFNPLTQLVWFIAQNSIWIYLWHIPLVKLLHKPFLEKYLLAYMGALLVTFIQVQLVRRWLLPRVSHPATSRTLQAVLTG